MQKAKYLLVKNSESEPESLGAPDGSPNYENVDKKESKKIPSKTNQQTLIEMENKNLPVPSSSKSVHHGPPMISSSFTFIPYSDPNAPNSDEDSEMDNAMINPAHLLALFTRKKINEDTLKSRLNDYFLLRKPHHLWGKDDNDVNDDELKVFTIQMITLGLPKMANVVLKYNPSYINITDDDGRSLLEIALMHHCDDKEKADDVINFLFENCINLEERDIKLIGDLMPEFYSRNLGKQVNFHEFNGNTDVVYMNMRYMANLCRKTKSGDSYFLTYLANRGRKDLLEHVLVQTYLALEWKAHRKIFWSSFTAYIIQLLFYTLFVYSYFVTGKSSWTEHPIVGCGFVGFIVVASFRALWLLGKHFILKIQALWICFLMESLVPAVLAITLVALYDDHHDAIVKSIEGRCVTAVISWIAWANILLFYLRYHPEIGIYVEMITRVGTNFVFLFLTFLCLLIGFTLSFSILLKRESLFEYPFPGFIVILKVLAGDLNMEKDEHEVGSGIPFAFCILFVGLFLVNLLIGLAVNNIKKLLCESSVKKTIREIQYLNWTYALVQRINDSKLFSKLCKKSLCNLYISIDAFPEILEVHAYKLEDGPIPNNLKDLALDIAQKNLAKKNASGDINYRASFFSSKPSKNSLEVDSCILKAGKKRIRLANSRYQIFK